MAEYYGCLYQMGELSEEDINNLAELNMITAEEKEEILNKE